MKYLAGLLDADGSLSFSFKQDVNRKDRHFIGLRLTLASSDSIDKKGFVESLPQKTGMGSISRYGPKSQYIQWIVVKHNHLEMLLPRLIKHMVIKAQHWHWLLHKWRELRVDNKTCSDEERVALTKSSKESRKNRIGPLKPKNHPTWAWLAGYLDGDGWYTNRLNRSGKYGSMLRTMQIGAVSHINDMSVLEFLQKSFGGHIRQHGQSDNVMVWVRSMGAKNRDFALKFLPNVAKHSRLKRHKIDAMIHHHRQRLSVPSTKVQAIV